MGWIHWHLGEPALAAGRLPRSIEQEFSQLDGTNKESSQWTKVCALKASYIKGSSLKRTGSVAEALETFESALPILSGPSSSSSKELRTWQELFLTGFCMVSSHAIKSRVSSILETETLSAFRAWARFWESHSSSTITGGHEPQAEVSRRHIWKEYYITLTDLLQQDLPFPISSLTTAYVDSSTRIQQLKELKQVEARYEALLLSEVQFPKAEEASEEVEAFVDIVMQNWRILCGSGWNEQDLGAGSEEVSRGVLDILYRAATKTFHSTAILRHLFTVHLSVAEFDLAFKAFDTYLEIVTKGKARAEENGEPEHGLDDDETVLKTVSDCIKALCRYGTRQGAEKAKDLAQFFEDWLEKHYPRESLNGNGKVSNGNPVTVIAPRTFAQAWRCIGIGRAQWARLTYDATSRAEIQLRAIKCLRIALLPEYEGTADVETLFALGAILAERRELAAAIEVVKAGLLSPSASATVSSDLGPHVSEFTRERSLIPLWHLMALLLSARQDFITAARSCEGAFEQFKDPRNLFGETELNGGFRSEHLNSNEKFTQIRGVVDDMDDFEKENVLEVKMTQLALIEVLEGPEIAVNASDELLGLYARLFGDPSKDKPAATVLSAGLVPPKSSAGTIRSIKGSIFGRSGRSNRRPTHESVSSENTVLPSRPQTTNTIASFVAPTIQVTNENGNLGSQRLNSMKEHHHEKLKKRNNSLKRSASAAKVHDRDHTASSTSHPTIVDGEPFFTPTADSASQDQWLGDDDLRSSQVGLALSPNEGSFNSSVNSTEHAKPLPPKTQRMNHKELPLKAANPNPPLAQDMRLPPPHSFLLTPAVRFSKDQQRRRRIIILVKVWLLISGFYRRAAMYEDAKGAIEEAHKLVSGLDAEIAKDSTGNVSSDQVGWGGGKSVAELWGDVFSEVSSLTC